MFTTINNFRRGQSLIEYVIIVGVAATAVYVMAPTLKRGTQRLIKATADQLGAQEDAEQDSSAAAGHMDNQISSTSVSVSRNAVDLSAGINYFSDEITRSSTETSTNGGIR